MMLMAGGRLSHDCSEQRPDACRKVSEMPSSSWACAPIASWVISGIPEARLANRIKASFGASPSAAPTRVSPSAATENK